MSDHAKVTACPVCARTMRPLEPQPQSNTWTVICPSHPTVILTHPRKLIHTNQPPAQGPLSSAAQPPSSQP